MGMNRLRQVLIDNDGKVSSRCKKILSAADFVPEEASLLPLGDCLGSMTPTHQPGVPNGTLEEVSEGDMDATWADDYLLTFIVPGIIITLMLLLAAVIACVLYRRRRTGKLGLEERRGFVSKGIPIIFAEELEERPSGLPQDALIVESLFSAQFSHLIGTTGSFAHGAGRRRG